MKLSALGIPSRNIPTCTLEPPTEIKYILNPSMNAHFSNSSFFRLQKDSGRKGRYSIRRGTCKLSHIRQFTTESLASNSRSFHLPRSTFLINFTCSFYIRRLTSDCNQTPIILVPTRQFETFLKIVSQKLKIQLAIPSGGGVSAFEITFDNDDTPRPRYLGKSTDREMADNLHSTVPPHWFKHRTEAATTVAPSDRSLAAFKAKMDLIAQAQKGKKTFTAEKKKGERIAKQRSWNHSVKRVQRYLGLRQASDEQQAEVVRVRDSVANSGLEWNAYSSAVKAATPRYVLSQRV